jgi:cellulose synthase/poly-beta-1,6-N-acetylglucosamine synthase-like glycosyltransferase
MPFVAFIFWICLAWLSYAFALYPLALFLASATRQLAGDVRQLRGAERRCVPTDWPGVSLILAARNEAATLPAKLANLAALDYPHDRLEFILVSDGSDDATAEVLASWPDPRAQRLVLPARRGKAAALTAAVALARFPVLLFCDAATLLEPGAVRQLAGHFSDARVGVVCGAVHFRGGRESRQTEGVYWRYEMVLRLLEARLGATLTSSGALYAMRRAAFRPLPPGSLLDDLLLLWTARRQGYGVVLDMAARGEDIAAPSVRGEFSRRLRIAEGSFQALPSCWGCRMGAVTRWAFVSHKLMRWLAPWPALGMVVSTCLLVAAHPGYRLAFAVEMAVLLWALAGALGRRWLARVPGGLLAYFGLAMNLALALGLCRWLAGRMGWSRPGMPHWESAQ